MTTRTLPVDGLPEPAPPARPSFRRAYARVLLIEVAALAGLWVLQSCHGGG